MNIKSQEKLVTYELTTEELVAQARSMEELSADCLEKILTFQRETNRGTVIGNDPRLNIEYFQREVIAAFLGVENCEIEDYTPEHGTGTWEVVVKTSD